MFTPNPQARQFQVGQVVRLKEGRSINAWAGTWTGPHTFTVVNTYSDQRDGDSVCVKDPSGMIAYVDLNIARNIFE